MSTLDFDSWYLAERPKVVASVATITGRPGVASDAADEAFTRAVERWKRVSAMDSPGGWVHRTALNVARRRLRRDRAIARLARAHTTTKPPDAAPPDWPLEFWDALDLLTPRERQAVVLRHVADLTTRDIAAAMGISTGTVSSTLHSARRRMSDATQREATDA